MKRPEMNRRDFNRLTFAAFGGVVAGSMTGCQPATPPAPATDPEAGSTTAGGHDDHDHAADRPAADGTGGEQHSGTW